VEEVTDLLLDWNRGNSLAREKLFGLVYPELRRLAAARMHRERQEHTLQPTALVNEACVSLLAHKRIQWQNRAHFFGISVRLMRRSLLKYAVRRSAAKRGSGQANAPLDDEVAAVNDAHAQELMELDRALAELAAMDPRQGQIVRLRFFEGLSAEETATRLGISPATVKRDWRVARAWLSANMRTPREAPG
jgi:RNA polymerase sigma factor (TIGR02999 family)